MASQGKVVLVTPDGAMVVVDHQNGYCLVELIGNAGRLSVGDVVLGQWDADGKIVLRGNEIFDCRFQGTWASFAHAVAGARRASGEQ